MSSVLTSKEREGLDDVFLSIHSDTKKFIKLKDFSASKLLKRVKLGLKEYKFLDFTVFIDKKKKNLSK